MKFKLFLLLTIISLVSLIMGCICCTSSNDNLPTATPSKAPSPVPTIAPSPTPILSLSFKGNYTDSPYYYKSGTPENTLVLYMDAIYRHDFDKLLSLRLPSWVEGQREKSRRTGNQDIEPLTMMKTMYGDTYLEGYTVKEFKKTGYGEVEARLNVYLRFPTPTSELWYYPLTVTMKEEGGKYYVEDYYTNTYATPWP